MRRKVSQRKFFTLFAYSALLYCRHLLFHGNVTVNDVLLHQSRTLAVKLLVELTRRIG
jgi:hypothetical protein